MVSYGQGGAFLGTEMDLGDSRAGNAWVAVALVSASAWALQALKQQARADGGNGGEGHSSGMPGWEADRFVLGGEGFLKRNCPQDSPRKGPLWGTLNSYLSVRIKLPLWPPQIPHPSWPAFPGQSQEESLQAGGQGGGSLT